MEFNTNYNNKLVEAVRDSFVFNVNTKEFAIAICHHDTNFLSPRVAERIKQKYFYSSDRNITYDLNNELLDDLKIYYGWFEAIIEVLNKQECPQPHVVSEMTRLKADLDKTWPSTTLKGKHKIDSRNEVTFFANGEKKKEKSRKSLQMKNQFNRTSNNSKCSCGNCNFTKQSQLCCFGVVKNVGKMHPTENKMCMSKWTVVRDKVINKSFLDNHYADFLTSPPKSKRAYFKLASKVYIREIYGHLGKGEGRVIPTCIQNIIGNKFPCFKKGKSYKFTKRRS